MLTPTPIRFGGLAGLLTLLGVSACQSSSCSGESAKRDPAMRASVADAKSLVEVRKVGTAHSVLLEQADPGGRWAVVCQPREDTSGDGEVVATTGTHGELTGDRSDPYLVQDDAEGWLIDAYVAHDPSGRYVAVIAEEQLTLVDTVTKSRQTLVANPEDDDDPFLSHRAAVFGPMGKSMAYARTVDDEPKVVVRMLSSGEEQLVDPGPGTLWRFELASGGTSVGVRVLTRDSDDNGFLEFPVTRSSIARRGCRGSGSYTYMGKYGDDPVSRIISVSTGKSTTVGRIETALGHAWVVSDTKRTKDKARALHLMTAEGDSSELASTSCDGVVLHADHERTRALIACYAGLVWNGPLKTLPLELNGAAEQVPLGLWINRDHLTFTESRGARHMIRNGAPRSMLIDLENKRHANLEEHVIALHEDSVLIRKSGSYVLRDLSTGRDTSIGAWDMPKYGEIFSAGRFVWLAPMLIDLQEARVVGQLDALVYELSRTGQVLHLPVGAPMPEYRELPTGPLSWSRAP